MTAAAAAFAPTCAPRVGPQRPHQPPTHQSASSRPRHAGSAGTSSSTPPAGTARRRRTRRRPGLPTAPHPPRAPDRLAVLAGHPRVAQPAPHQRRAGPPRRPGRPVRPRRRRPRPQRGPAPRAGRPCTGTAPRRSSPTSTTAPGGPGRPSSATPITRPWPPYAEARADEVTFWAWCQWVADTQLAAAAARPVDLVTDLAGGFDGRLVRRVGAPGPSHLRLRGRLSTGQAEPRRAAVGPPAVRPGRAGSRRLRAMARHRPVRAPARPRAAHRPRNGAVRLFWVLAGGSAADGVYVTYPATELLVVLVEEAMLRGAWVRPVGQRKPCRQTARPSAARIGARHSGGVTL
jgi:hypothetical protein